MQPVAVSNGDIYKEANSLDGEVQRYINLVKISEQGRDSLKWGTVEYTETPGLNYRNDIHRIKQPDREVQLARVINPDSIEAQSGQDQNKLQNHTHGVVNQHSISSTCSPKYHVSFTKIHKTGSGANHNLLLRLALRHNLTVALPYCQPGFKKYQILPAVSKRRYTINNPPHQDRHGYNLFFDQAVYDRNAQLKYMAPNTLFYTQIRSPFSQAVSCFKEFGGVKRYGLQSQECPFCSFISSGKEFEETYFQIRNCWHPNHAATITRNFQAFTLGYMNAYENNVTEFKSYLEQLDKELFHVSLLECIDESNLLLKRKMCWHISDVLHIHTHKTKYHNNISSVADEITKKAKNKHHESSKLGYMLYEFFKEKLLKELQQQPADFSKELEQYKALKSQFSELCDKMCKDFHCAKKSVTTMLTYPWKCTVLHCNHLGNTWKPLVLMTQHFDYHPR